MMRNVLRLVLLLCGAQVTFGQIGATSADVSPVPTMIKFNGTIRDLEGKYLSGSQSLTFGFYKNPEGGVPVWTETETLALDGQGHYIVLLGSTSTGGVPMELFASGETQWIGVTPGDGIERPRVPITTVPYAFKAAEADTIGGRRPEEFVSMQYLSTLLESGTGKFYVAPAGPGTSITGQSVPVIPSLNADLLHGFPDSSFAKLRVANIFAETQSLAGGARLPAVITDPTHSSLLDSAPLDFESSIVEPQSGIFLQQKFRWVSQPIASASGVPVARLSLLFGAGSATPSPTGLSLNSDGTITFAPGQQLPSEAVITALSGSQSGGGNTSNPSNTPIVDTAQYSWTQTLKSASSINVGANEVTLTPCPAGVNGTDVWHYLYISGTGTPEVVLITGGSCTSGAAGGTIQFTATYVHPSGYTISSATDGVQEAVIAAVMPNTGGAISRQVLIDPGTHIFRARLSIRGSAIQVSSSGATINCAMSDTCIMIGDPANSNGTARITLTGLRVSAGVPNGTWPAVEDNAEGSVIHDFGPSVSPIPGGSFGSLIQIDNDQAAVINGLDTNLAPWARCDTTFCSTGVVGPGPFGTNAGVIWVENSNLSLQCMANGIDNQDANTLRVTNSVIQAYPQFGTRSRTTYASANVQLSGVYTEVGNCTNPLGTGQAGLIVEGGQATVSSTVGPSGVLPVFANTGPTPYSYYIVVHSSVMGTSSAYLAGYANTTGSGPINVRWNQIGKTGTITYDVLRIVGTGGGGTIAPFGTGSFAVATGVPATTCSNGVCSFTDDAASTPASYTVSSASTFWPSLFMWPGSVILTTAFDMQNTGGSVPTQLYVDSLGSSGIGGIVVSGGASQPSVFAQECDPQGSWSSVWMQCLGGNAVSNDNPAVIGTVLQLSSNGGAPGGLKGRVIFEIPPLSEVNATHVITLADSNPTKTFATPGNRPGWDPNDTYIGYDQPLGLGASKTQLSFGAPTSISQYIGNPGDNVSWGERLTLTAKTFKVPVQANDITVGTLTVNGPCQGIGCGPFSPSGTQATDTFTEPNSGTLGSNWTTVDGTCSILNNQAQLTIGSDTRVFCAYTGSSFTNNQYAVAQLVTGVNSQGVCVRMSSAAETGYCFAAATGSGPTTALQKWVDGVGSTITAGGPAASNGDVLRLEVNESTLTAYDITAGFSLTGTDGGIPITSGSPGLFGYNSSGPVFANFRGGNLSYSTNDSIQFGGALNQTAAGTWGNSCTMSSATTCTLTISNSYTMPICIATAQGTSAIAAACSVSGTTVTITAASSNSLIWGAFVFGNPN